MTNNENDTDRPQAISRATAMIHSAQRAGQPWLAATDEAAVCEEGGDAALRLATLLLSVAHAGHLDRRQAKICAMALAMYATTGGLDRDSIAAIVAGVDHERGSE